MKRNSKAASIEGKKNKPLTPARARRERDKKNAIALYLKGNTMQKVRDIMEEETGHNFATSTIHKFINEGITEWRANKDHMVAAHKEIELEKINRLESEYWLAWERSKQPYENTSETKSVAGKDSKVTQIKTDKRAMHGDPRFLEGIHRCVEMRNKLLGIEVPAIQINQTTGSGGNSTTIIQRRVVFKTRETTTQQEIPTEEE